MSWRDLSPAEARAHPLHGVGGWLFVFFGLILFALVADAIEWIQYGEGSDRPAWLIALTFAINVAILVTGVRLWRWFPELAIAGIWLTGGLGQLFTAHVQAAPGPDDAVDPRQIGIVAFVAFSLLLTWLLRASERVNVTYKRRCRSS